MANKKTMKHYLNWACLILFLIGSGVGHAQFVIWGEIREKIQFRDGYREIKGPGDMGYLLNVQRTRLGMSFEKNDLGFVVVAEDTRTWGESVGSATQDGFGLSSAYFYVRFCERFTFDIGRRDLSYDDGRFISDVGWSDKTVSLDALMFKYKSLDKKTSADIGFSFSNDPSSSNFLTAYSVKNMYKYFVWGWASHEFAKKNLIWSVLYAQEVNEKDLNKNILFNKYTVGTNFSVFPDRQLGAYVSLYGQWGKGKTGQAIGAYLASVQLKYNPHPKIEVVLAYDFTSGTNYKQAYGNLPGDAVGLEGASKDFTSRAFDKFIGSGHSFFGYQDLFSIKGTSDLSQGAGLHQPYVRLFYKPHKQHSIEFTGRYFSLVHPYVIDRSLPKEDVLSGAYQKMPKSLGTELDILYKYQIFEELSLGVGYSFMLPTKNNTLERISAIAPNQSKFSQFAYIVVAYKPVLFDSEYNSRKKAGLEPKGYRHKKGPDSSLPLGESYQVD